MLHGGGEMNEARFIVSCQACDSLWLRQCARERCFPHRPGRLSCGRLRKNKRGTAEQWIKEGKYALNWTRLSCHDFADNQVRLQLFALAYNLGNFLRRLALPKKIRDWSLRTLQVKLIKIGAKVIRHSRYVIFQMAEVMVSKSLFHEILKRISHLKPVPIGFG